MSDWQSIETAPDDFSRPGGQRAWRLRERDGRETTGRRTYFNNSGWLETNTNRELWPTHWMPLPGASPGENPTVCGTEALSTSSLNNSTSIRGGERS